MKAAVCTRYGPPEVLVMREVPRPEPKPDQVRIRVFATAVTSSDTYVRGINLPFAFRVAMRIVLGVRAPRQPILGMVLAGEVDSVGRDVSAFKPGDQVFGMNLKFGAYAEYACWPAGGLLAARPANLRFAESAALPYGGLLASHFLRKAGVRSGERVLIYGASGAVGTSAVQLARHMGAEVTGVCSAANFDLVRSLGAVNAIDYTKEDFTQRPERYDVVLDAVGRRKSRQALVGADRALLPGGRVVSVDDGSPKLVREDLLELKRLAETGELKPVIDRTYTLDRIADAHRYVDQGHKKGNVIVQLAHGE